MTKPPFLSSPRLRLVAVVGALAAIGVGAAELLPGLRPAPAAAAPQPAQAAGFKPTTEQWTGIGTADVQARTFRTIVAAEGAIAYDDERTTPVFSPYSGRVVRLVARPGDRVAKGDPLMVVDASEFVQAQGDAVTAHSALDHAIAVEHRQHELFDAGIAALKDWQQAQADLAAAKAAWSAVRGRLRILGHTDREIDALAKAAPTGSEAVVRAPLAGTVTQRQVGLGQYIQSASAGASSPAFTVSDLSTVWLVANVRESEVPQLRVGQEAEVRVLALPGKVFKARVAWIGAGLDPATHRVPVRAEVKTPDGELKPQMFASFAISAGDEATAPAVPESAVMYDGAATRVFVVAADGSIAGRTVTTGRTADGLVEITSGLRAGEKIVTSGALFVDRAISAAGS